MRLNLKFILLFLGLFIVFSAGFLIGKTDRKQILSEQTVSSPTPNLFASIQPKSTGTNLGNLYKVAKVVDGDTIDVYIDGKSKAVRLIGIDTPEVVDPRKPVQCFGEQASEESKKILTGQSIYLESDPTQGDLDKYKRLLRYVFLQDGTNFNLMMITQGYAHEYTYNLPYKYQAVFKAAEKEARDKDLGLWSPDTCNGNTGNSSAPISSTSDTGIPDSKNSYSSSYKPTGTYACDCSKLCSQIKTCDEAYYQLQNCGCSSRDSDGDGIPCESLCN